MATAKQRAWRLEFGRRYGNKGKARKTRRMRGGNVARKGKSRRSKGGIGGFGGILSTNNLLGTLGGAYVAPMVGVSPAIGAAAGSYFIGKKGIMGAAVGYFVAPMVLGMINKTGTMTTASTVLY